MSRSTWVNVIPCISTAHCPSAEELDRFTRNDNACAPWINGAFIFIGDTTSDEEFPYIPAWMQEIARWAWANHGEGVTWVRLDADGDVIPELQHYNW